MSDITMTIRLARGQVVELTEDEARELRDSLVRLLGNRPVNGGSDESCRPIRNQELRKILDRRLPPIVTPWQPPVYVGDVVPNPFEVTCGPAT